MALDFGLVSTFVILVGLEVVLGLDNLLVLTLITQRVKAEQQAVTRLWGIALAATLRGLLLFAATWVSTLTEPLFRIDRFDFTWRDIILVSGGGFLVYKAVTEIHEFVMAKAGENSQNNLTPLPVGLALAQVALFDMLFSIDSIVTAIGLTDEFYVAFSAIVLGACAMALFVKRLSQFLEANPSIRILALVFMMAIGFTLCLEAFDHTVPKQYLYAPLLFALLVQIIQILRTSNLAKQASQPLPEKARPNQAMDQSTSLRDLH